MRAYKRSYLTKEYENECHTMLKVFFWSIYSLQIYKIRKINEYKPLQINDMKRFCKQRQVPIPWKPNGNPLKQAEYKII